MPEHGFDPAVFRAELRREAFPGLPAEPGRMEPVTEPAGRPIRIAVRVDFSGGAEHTYDVRTEDAVAIPMGAAFWPEGVITSDVAKRMEHDRKRQEEIAALKAERDRVVKLLDDALFLRMNGERPPGAPANPEAETWRRWDREAERFLRSRLREEGWPDRGAAEIGP